MANEQLGSSNNLWLLDNQAVDTQNQLGGVDVSQYDSVKDF